MNARTAIVVPGSEVRGPDGDYRIGPVCVRLVREAERLAEAQPGRGGRVHGLVAR